MREQLAGAGRPAPFVLCGLLALGVVACGSGLRSAAAFDGSAEPRIAQPQQVTEQATLPEGYEAIGRVTSSCTLISEADALDGEWLSDVDCSESRLTLALKERVAEVGGALLVGKVCRSGKPRERGERRETTVRCQGEVGRPGAVLRGQQPLAGAVSEPAGPPGVTPDVAAALDEPSGTTAWNIRVDFQPAPHAPRRHPRRTDLVGELPVMPVSHVRLGDVVARCRAGCAEPQLRSGVRVVAARMGASNVIGVRCVNTPDGLTCAGTAAAYERDPATEPAL